MMRFAPLLLTACLLGEDPFKGAPNVPTIDGEARLIQPVPADEGPTWVREGSVVEVEFTLFAAISLEASSIRIDDAPLDCERVSTDQPTYRCRRTLDGTEANGAKGLRGVLAFDNGVTSTLFTEALVTADFRPPTAECTISPRIANGEDVVRLVVNTSEPLDARPSSPPARPR